MGTKYYELILSGRQLAVGVGVLVVLLGAAFLLGVGVGIKEPSRADTPAVPVDAGWEPAPAAEEVSSPAAAPTIRETAISADASPSPLPVPDASGEPPPSPTSSPTPTVPPPTAVPLVTVPVRAGHAEAVARVGHWVQVAALSRQELADGVRQRVVALGFRPEQVVIRGVGGSFRVRLGPFPDDSSARRVVSRLRAQGFADAFPVVE